MLQRVASAVSLRASGCVIQWVFYSLLFLLLAVLDEATLDKVREPKDPMSDRFAVGACKPKRGRLFLFPHGTPHAGRPVVDVPKVLLRGECYMVPNQ